VALLIQLFGRRALMTELHIDTKLISSSTTLTPFSKNQKAEAVAEARRDAKKGNVKPASIE
jgi:hypothetical protein